VFSHATDPATVPGPSLSAVQVSQLASELLFLPPTR
jgi:hypothetical protein